MHYFKLRHLDSGEITSLTTRKNDFPIRPGIKLICTYEGITCWKEEKISKEEFNMLLTFHNLTMDDINPRHIEYWLLVPRPSTL